MCSLFVVLIIQHPFNIRKGRSRFTSACEAADHFGLEPALKLTLALALGDDAGVLPIMLGPESPSGHIPGIISSESAFPGKTSSASFASPASASPTLPKDRF